MTISVVIPAYNCAKFLAATLDSVFCQTRLPNEIIVSDDASRDETAELVDTIARTSTVPLRLVRAQTNSGGPAQPLNSGIEAASGDLIATLDHDDLMMPQRLERQFDCFSADPTLGLVLVRCELRGAKGGRSSLEQYQLTVLEQMRTKELGRSLYRLDRQKSYDALVDGCYSLTCSNMMFPKTSWAQVGGFDKNFKLSADYIFIEKIANHFEMGYVDEILTSWTSRPESHYLSSHVVVQLREMVRIFASMDKSKLSQSARQTLKARLREERLGIAFFERERGHYLAAATSYSRSLFQDGLSGEAIFGLAKLIPHRLISLVSPSSVRKPRTP